MLIFFLFILTFQSDDLRQCQPPWKIGTGANEIIDGFLFHGTLGTARSEEKMKEYGIRMVISIHESFEIDWIYHYDGVEYHAFPQSDTKNLPPEETKEKMFEYFNRAFQLIEMAEKEGKRVLIVFGQSLSSALIVSYLVRKWDWEVNEALQYVKQRRNEANPQPLFIDILNQYKEAWKDLYDEVEPDNVDDERDARIYDLQDRVHFLEFQLLSSDMEVESLMEEYSILMTEKRQLEKKIGDGDYNNSKEKKESVIMESTLMKNSYLFIVIVLFILLVLLFFSFRCHHRLMSSKRE